MNKASLISAVSQKLDYTKTESTAAVDAVIECMIASLSEGERIMLIGLGTFNVTERAARRGRNPRTGQEMLIPAKKVIRFKAGSSLRKSVNGEVSA